VAHVEQAVALLRVPLVTPAFPDELDDPCLADTAEPRDRDKPRVVQLPTDRLDIRLATDQRVRIVRR
jgi:hypothetical protein